MVCVRSDFVGVKIGKPRKVEKRKAHGVRSVTVGIREKGCKGKGGGDSQYFSAGVAPSFLGRS